MMSTTVDMSFRWLHYARAFHQRSSSSGTTTTTTATNARRRGLMSSLLALQVPTLAASSALCRPSAGPPSPLPCTNNSGSSTSSSSSQKASLTMTMAAELQMPPLKPALKAECGIGLNPEQLAAVRTDQPYARVMAGPGTGKTRVLTQRILHLIDSHSVSPSDILCITFTNKAANEVRERLTRLLNDQASQNLWAGTFHSLCARLLRKRPDYGLNKGFQIYDDDDCERLLKSIFQLAGEHLRGDGAASIRIPDHPSSDSTSYASGSVDTLEKLGFFRNGSIENKLLLGLFDKDKGKDTDRDKEPQKIKPLKVSLHAIRSLLDKIKKTRLYSMKTFIASKRNRSIPDAPRFLQQEYIKIAEVYTEALRRNNAVDFDGLIHSAVSMLYNDSSFRRDCRDIWKHVLVDEFQDTDAVQYELVRLFATGNQSLFVVGDTNQAIYGWRGAEHKFMQNELVNDFPGIVTFQLVRNYRSSRNILKVASTICNYGQGSASSASSAGPNLIATKEYKAPIGVAYFEKCQDEGLFIVSEIQSMVSSGQADWCDFAVLYRARSQSFLIEHSLLKSVIPCTVVGATPFYSRKEIKILLAYMKLVANFQNEAALEYVINTPPRGIGEKTIIQIKSWASSNNLSLPGALEKIFMENTSREELGIRNNTRKSLVEFVQSMKDIAQICPRISLGMLIQKLIDRFNMKEYFNAMEHDEESSLKRWERIYLLKSIADSFEPDEGQENILMNFLQDMVLLEAEENKNVTSPNTVKLMTLHASKGLEFRCVFIIGTTEGIIPWRDSDEEEERRLFYVGVTRAKEHLYLSCHPNILIKKGEYEKPKLSPFLHEILTQLPWSMFVFCTNAHYILQQVKKSDTPMIEPRIPSLDRVRRVRSYADMRRRFEEALGGDWD